MNETSWFAGTSPLARKSAAEAVFDDLRAAILDGRIAPGSRLPPEAQLAERYGVSRPIVREALRSLQTLGMTQSRTGSGTFVLKAKPDLILPTSYSAKDLMEARPFIEVPSAGWAAVRRSEEQLAALSSLCNRMDAEMVPREWVKLDSEFHCLIAAASGNALFQQIVEDAREALSQQSEVISLVASTRREASNLEHRRIVEAIAAGSEPEAQRAMEAHLGEVKRVIAALLGSPR